MILLNACKPLAGSWLGSASTNLLVSCMAAYAVCPNEAKQQTWPHCYQELGLAQS